MGFLKTIKLIEFQIILKILTESDKKSWEIEIFRLGIKDSCGLHKLIS